MQRAVQGSSASPSLSQGPMKVQHRNLDPELVHPDSSGDNLQSPRNKDANNQEPNHDNMSIAFYHCAFMGVQTYYIDSQSWNG